MPRFLDEFVAPRVTVLTAGPRRADASSVPAVEAKVTSGGCRLPERTAIPPDREPELTVRLPAPEKK